MEKAQSFSKPILPRLNIERVKEENQNVLPFKGFHDITRNKSTRTPNLSVGLPKVGVIGDALNIGEREASDAKGASSRRDDSSKAEYLKNLAKRYDESYYTSDVPRYKMLRNKEYEGFTQSKQINMTLVSNFTCQSQKQKTWSCQLESKYLIMKKLSQQKEETKSKDPGYKEHIHETMFESYADDKMRLCLLNIFNLFIERYEASGKWFFSDDSNGSSHPVNLLYCHLSSNEICTKLKQLSQYYGEEKQVDVLNELFDSDIKFSMDFNGAIHYLNNNNTLSVTDISNTSYLEGIFQGDIQKLFSPSPIQSVDSSELENLLKHSLLFKIPLFSERVSIFKILQKTSTYNEYTMKTQVESSLDYLSSAHNTTPHDNMHLNLYKTHQAYQSLIGLASPTKTLLGTNNMSSFDASAANFYPKDHLQVENTYWVNGVGYSGEKVGKEKLRRKSDMFLVRVYNSLCYKLGNFTSEEAGWGEEISKDLVLLGQYIEKVHSRISIFQILDTIMSPLVVIKKILWDQTLKDRAGIGSNSGGAQSPFLNQDSLHPKSYSKSKTPIDTSLRTLFSTYLWCISAIFLKAKTQETFKLVSEVFLKDKAWQEAIQTFTTYLFGVDLMDEQEKKVFRVENRQTVVSIDEGVFSREFVISGLSSEERRSTDIERHLNFMKGVLKEVSQQARSAIHYYEWVNILIKNAIDDAKEKYSEYEDDKTKIQFVDVVTEVGQEYEDDDDDHDIDDGQPIEPEKDIEARNSVQYRLLNYWYKVQKRVLYSYAFLIAPANGILLHYLDNNGTNYFLKPIENSQKSAQFSEIVPINFFLTTTILKFWETLFTCAEKTLYSQIFTDELVLAFIGTHWICFTKLYDRSFKSVPVVDQDNSPFIDLCKTSRGLNWGSKIEPSLALLTLWKLHLKWMCVMANNRNEVIRKNLYQFKILDFWVREIDLEYLESVEKEERGRLRWLLCFREK
jgi:hypothetical protein